MDFISEFGGLGRLKELSRYYTGKNILLVTGKGSYKNSGAEVLIEKELNSENVLRFSNFSVNPKLEDALYGVKIAREAKIDVIMAVGGGSVIDMAKLIKAFYKSSDNEKEIAKGEIAVLNSKIPLIAIPTTAGSGSEATHFAVVYIGVQKYSVASQYLVPEAVILDGSLVVSSGQYLKSCNALDAMAQAIESAWANGSTEDSFRYSMTSLETGWNILPNFVSSNCSESNAQKMIEAANFAGRAINISKTTAAHAWSYAFTSLYNIPHGHSVWLTLPVIFEAHATAIRDDITDIRGSEHLETVMRRLSYILNLNKESSFTNQLQHFLIEIGVEYQMEQLGLDGVQKRLSLSDMVNSERMGNNPVNLERFKTKIFNL